MRAGAFAAAGVALVCAASSAAPAVAADAAGPFFTRIATAPAYLNAADPAVDAAVAEISTVSPDGMTVISTDSAGQRLGFFDITDPANPQPLGGVGVGGEPTSVYATGDYILAVVDTSDGDFANPSGHVSVLDADSHAVLATIELGGQPDSIDVTDDGAYAVIAIENQRDEEFTPEGGGSGRYSEGDLPQLPAGGLAIIPLTGAPSDWAVEHVDLTGLEGLDTPEDPEPEYVTISPDDSTVAVTLQENNGVAIVDIASATVLSHFSTGTTTVTGIDALDDDHIALVDTITDVPREPDAIGWVGADHLATANEGDWKGGSRGWTVFDAATGDVAWDSGNSFDHLAVQLGLYPDKRSDAKGSEPEGLLSATFDGVPYVFVGSERANFVAVYDVTDPAAPVFVQALPSTPGPEGLLAIPERGLLVVSSETDDAEALIRATVQVYQLGAATPSFPTIESAVVDGTPIAWGAQSGLSADPADPSRLYSVSDNAYTPSEIYAIDTSVVPAVIDRTLTVTEGGEPAALDLEGVFARPDGGFWVVNEGATGAENTLIRLDATGAVVETIALPADVAAGLGKQGFEGVTSQTVDGHEVVWTALQRSVTGDPDGVVRLGRYDVTAGTWSFYGYQLEAASGVKGDWNGLSEITLTGAGTLAVIERDKLNGPDAVLKAIYTVPLPSEAGSSELTVLPKTLAVDVLPTLLAGAGWTQEKLEGLTVGGDGDVYVITDNDGVDDANGETVFANLGTSAELFGTGATPEPTPTATPAPSATASATPAPVAGGSLAATGVETGWLAAAAAALLAAGGVLLGRRRRAE
ncbi:esterase-like activity of phytase family protein [Microbacteriaceae bacterium VKM Ac-2854]|nr:esterase-like activity of phytase family protein [Microbacteriaceae bacterium VKM Ac-2854]